MNDRSAEQAALAAGDTAPAGLPGPHSEAGAMLRRARKAQGLHIAALAASIKVPQAKLEALEAGRFNELPDATFVRVLAQAVCRALKIDPLPVLAELPAAGPLALDKVEGGLNTPFRDRPGRIDPLDRLWLRNPVTWLVMALLLGAAAVAFVPTEWLRGLTGARPSAPGLASEAAKPAAAEAAVPVAEAASVAQAADTVSTAAPVPASSTPASVALAPEAPAGPTATTTEAAVVAQTVSGNVAPVQIRAIESTWVQATDPAGKVLFSGLVNAGETAGVDAPPPMKIRIGNAKGTELRWRGQVVDIASSTRANTATVDLR